MQIDEALQDRIYGWAYRLLQNHHDAADATQEVLLRALRQPAREVQRPAAWLRRVTVNHCLDLRRRVRAPEELPVRSADSTSPDAAASSNELCNAVLIAMQRLSEQQRLVLIAKVYDQETFAAIADAMELSIGTVKTHYLRALRGMRDALKAHAETDQ
ncbi:MAG: sigma-70 family RNA polymerase sigma factor [Phycisphaerales bacterium]|nr:sigma-70 family RNA polymerase sigma factor [Phycisphaerales bacterium]